MKVYRLLLIEVLGMGFFSLNLLSQIIDLQSITAVERDSRTSEEFSKGF